MQTPGGPRNDDALELLAASNVKAAYEDVNPWLLTTAASPHLAARHDGVTIGHEKIAIAHRRLAAQSDLVLVEGAGGWLAPISATETMADIAEKLALPVIFVVGMRLGCLNHALLTREAIRSCGPAVRRLDREQDARGNGAGGREYRHLATPLRRAATRHRPGGRRPAGTPRWARRWQKARKPLSAAAKSLV